MQERLESFLAPFRREPDQTKLLIRVGLAGPLVITVWNLAGVLVISNIVVSLVSLLLMLIYGAAMLVMVTSIMTEDERWQADSEANSRRLGRRLSKPQASDPEPVAVSEAKVTSLRQDSPGSFQQVHFMLHFQEEVARARREGLEISLVWLEVNLPGGGSSLPRTEKMAVEVAHLLVSQAKTIGQQFNLNSNEYVFTLPAHNQEMAHAFVSKLVQALGNYWCNCGIATYRVDGTDGESLFRRARQLCRESASDNSTPGPRGFARSAS